MIESPDSPKDLQRYILPEQTPVICKDETTWRAFMNDGDNLLVARDTIGKFIVITVFLGFNYGTTEKPAFFQTTCLGADSENRPHYSANWKRAHLPHRGTVECAKGLTRFAAEGAAGIDRSFEFIDCNVIPGELQFILKSEADAVKFLPEDKKHWKRRGRMIVFCFPMELPQD